jgi:HAE1 family hydrophobic/amphiphilic exporter-1
MTTFAMILGMLPVAAGLGEGSETRSPMGVAVIGGLLTSLFLTSSSSRRPTTSSTTGRSG